MRAEPVLAEPEHLVAGPEGADSCADRLDDAGELAPRIVARGFAKPLKKRTIHGSAARKPQSVRFTVAACTRTSTS